MLGRGQTDPEKVIPAETSPITTSVVPELLPTSQVPHQGLPSTTGMPPNGGPSLHADPTTEYYSPKQTSSPASILLPQNVFSRDRFSMFFENTNKGFSTHFKRAKERFPTFFTALPRLPFALVPFAFSQFILIEALTHQGWIDVFATWLVRATHLRMYPTIWVIGVIGVILCNLSGTNIGATILLTKVVRAANMPPHSLRAAAIALAVASNIGAVSFTFSASLAGLLWKTILNQKNIPCKQRQFAMWNLFPLTAMTAVGLSVVSAEMAVLYGGNVS